MIRHHPSRPFRQFPMEHQPNDRTQFQAAPGVHLELVEHVRETFAIQLAPERQEGLDGAVNTAIAMAEQRGREEVISYLNALANRPNE